MAKRERRSSSKDKTAKDEARKSRKKGSAGGRGAWKVMDRGSTVAAGLLAREVSQLAWRAATGRKPPVAGRNPEVETREAVAWAVVGGALVELVKLLVRRWTAGYWVRSTGSLPPGMKPVKPSVVGSVTPKEPAPTREPAPDIKRERKRRRGVAQ
ncbi:DUF4235 domain-containing protein [Aeromicrobium sp. CF4.19]|uniref:DUF4235 domain-containing protein n=1 Tax=Aeromicrobium sp. CF4.19 TaxID=3373082 RepID=UPI003EE58CB4